MSPASRSTHDFQAPAFPLFLLSSPASLFLLFHLLGNPAGFGGAAHRRLRRQQQADRPAHPAPGRPAGRLPPHLPEERGQQAAVAAHRFLPNHPQDLRARRLWRWAPFGKPFGTRLPHGGFVCEVSAHSKWLWLCRQCNAGTGMQMSRTIGDAIKWSQEAHTDRYCER